MRRKKGYEYLLLLTYIIMAGVCVYLNVFSKGQAEGLSNLIVNIIMFVIVGGILLTCYRGSLRPISKIVKDLERVTEKIEDDAKHTHRFLWEKYREDKEELFQDEILKQQFQDYQYELDRIVHTDKTYYKCDIEDYISYDLIDSVMHRNRMNQVAGVMTGLGILGTFIGLSLGLQSFNTGTTAEITNSIEPLMNGIKVAFHTSIYGMVFSLVFNYVYRRKLDEAENALREFVSAYKKYVLPDTATDGVNRLMELQQQQTEAIKSLSYTVAHQLSEGLKELLEPQFDRFDRTIVGFANMATKNQMDQLTMVVNAFINEMDRSLAGAFTRMSETIDKTLVQQNSNTKQIEEIYAKNLSTAENVNAIATQTGAVANALMSYAEQVQSLEKQTADTVEVLRQQTERNREILTGAGQYMTELEAYRKSLDITVAGFDDRLREQEARLRDLQKLTADMPREVEETFKIINENLQIVETHFKETIEQINRTVRQVPDLVDYSYRGIEQGFDKASKSLEELTNTIRKLESSYYRQ